MKLSAKQKIVIIGLGTLLVHLVLGFLMIILWNWLFDGTLYTILFVLTLVIAGWNALKQIPWTINKIKDLKNS